MGKSKTILSAKPGAKKAAHHLDPSNEYLEDLYAHKRLYALLLIDADIDLNKAEDSDIASIQKAITLLRECRSNNKEEQEHHKRALAAGLMRRVDTLREKIAFNYYSSDFESIRKHKIEHQQDIAILIKTLGGVNCSIGRNSRQSLALATR